MLIPHPLLGLRDAAEFTYLGDAALLSRPDGFSDAPAEAALDAFHSYQHLRDNPAGLHRELWYHEFGDRSWLIVTRDTRTHEIVGAELARSLAPPPEAAA
ncbi:MAG: sarcosine oxidase subunit delta [Roseinatronobacter sp.]